MERGREKERGKVNSKEVGKKEEKGRRREEKERERGIKVEQISDKSIALSHSQGGSSQNDFKL